MMTEPEAREAAAKCWEALDCDGIAKGTRDRMRDLWTDYLIDHIRANFAPLQELTEALAEVARLRKELERATMPEWFAGVDSETGSDTIWDVIDGDYDPLPGSYVYEVRAFTSLPSIWCAVSVTDDEDADERFTFTEHATEEAARAALENRNG